MIKIDNIWRPVDKKIKPNPERRIVMRTNRELHPDAYWIEPAGSDLSKYAQGFLWCYLDELIDAHETAKKMVDAVAYAKSVSAARRAVNVLYNELLGDVK